MPSLFFSAALIAALALLPVAHAAKGHAHGEGRLDVAIGKEQIVLSLELPLDAAIGFERAPKNDKEKALLAAAAATLNDAAALFLPTPAASCTLHSVQIDMPQFDGGAHADIAANYTFRCANPAALKSIETTLFRSFKRLYRIEVQRVSPAGQGAARLSPKQSVLSW
ncbi:MAG: DUF2796 domain-containing protein [Rhodocyclaceae bacterium]|nr:DUF2796 domain-containing protein [Rhodocyclaceae bacterium]